MDVMRGKIRSRPTTNTDIPSTNRYIWTNWNARMLAFGTDI